MRVKIVKKDEYYELEGCPKNYGQPLSCQMKGCTYWGGYMFKNAKYGGFKDYISSQWRKYMVGEVNVADYVLCNYKEEGKKDETSIRISEQRRKG